MDIIREAGWPIYPVLLLGTLAVLTSLGHPREPRREKVPLCIGLIAATVLMGLWGTALGIEPTVRGMRDLPPEQKWMFFEGLRETLNNLDVSLLFAIVATLLSAFGSQRLERAPSDVVPSSR
jgi:hypothetical protein